MSRSRHNNRHMAGKGGKAVKAKYKYCVKARFSSDLYTQTEWVPISWHEKLEDAKKAFAWQLKYKGEYTQVQIFPAQ